MKKSLHNWTRQHYTITTQGRFGPVERLVRGYVSPRTLFGLHKHGKFRRWLGLGHWRITHLRTGLNILPGNPIKHLPVARDTALILESYGGRWHTADKNAIRRWEPDAKQAMYQAEQGNKKWRRRARITTGQIEQILLTLNNLRNLAREAAARGIISRALLDDINSEITLSQQTLVRMHHTTNPADEK